MKFYYDYKETEDELLNLHEMQLMRAFKYRIMWELRLWEQAINQDGGTIYLKRDYKLRLAMNSHDLAQKLEKLIATIDWETW